MTSPVKFIEKRESEAPKQRFQIRLPKSTWNQRGILLLLLTVSSASLIKWSRTVLNVRVENLNSLCKCCNLKRCWDSEAFVSLVWLRIPVKSAWSQTLIQPFSNSARWKNLIQVYVMTLRQTFVAYLFAAHDSCTNLIPFQKNFKFKRKPHS